jgi:uncharacterized membrane protein
MPEGKDSHGRLAWLKSITMALPFGIGIMLIMGSGLHIPIPGTEIVTDPREILVTLGSALTGPVGAVVIGLMAGVIQPLPDFRYVSMIIHVIAAVWVGFAYKKLVYKYLKMPLILLGWIGLVITYYYLFLVPVLFGLMYLDPVLYVKVFGDQSLLKSYLALNRSLLPEVVLTSLFTAMIIIVLPRLYRRPLW